MRPMEQAQQLGAILTTAAALGYYTQSIDERKVVLYSAEDQATITIDGVLVGGSLIRKLLRPLEAPFEPHFEEGNT